MKSWVSLEQTDVKVSRIVKSSPVTVVDTKGRCNCACDGKCAWNAAFPEEANEEFSERLLPSTSVSGLWRHSDTGPVLKGLTVLHGLPQ